MQELLQTTGSYMHNANKRFFTIQSVHCMQFQDISYLQEDQLIPDTILHVYNYYRSFLMRQVYMIYMHT